MISTRVLIGIFFIVASSCIYGGEGQIYAYYGFFQNPVSPNIHDEEIPFVINRQRNIVYAGDAVYPAKFCEDDDKFICVTSNIFSFAIPKKLQKKRQWSFDGKEYRLVKGLHQRKILGEVIDIYMIECREGELVEQFIFSPSNGLLAYGVRSLDKLGLGWFVWSSKRKGFGAN